MGKGNGAYMGKPKRPKNAFSDYRYDELATFYGMTLDDEQELLKNDIIGADKELIFVNAKAGTGKTTIALGCANILYCSGLYDKIIYIMSPYGEAKQGFLPGDITEKSEVYFQPLYDAMIALNLNPYAISTGSLDLQKEGNAYIYPITDTYSRGINFSNAVVIVDEAQNMEFSQLKRILTRPHDDCKVIVCGHVGQRDNFRANGDFERYLSAASSSELEWISVRTLTHNHRGHISTWCDEVYK